MTSQTIQGWHPNPQLMQPQHQAPPPQGWTGSWPPGGNVVFPPGYPGPPPIPGDTAAHPRWNAGYWQYNPQANMQNPQQPWAPGMGWFPPNFNPYKRVPKPPSPSYWNTKLSNNGLGLEGMVKRRDPAEYEGEEPRTPWIWNPPSLRESGDRATPTRDFNVRKTGSTDNSAHNVSTPTRDHGQSSRGSSQDGLSTQVHNQTPERRSSSQANYFYPPQDNSVTPTGPTRQSSDSEVRYNYGGSGFAGLSASSQRSASTDLRISRSRSQPPALSEVPPYPPPTPTISRSASAQQALFTQEPETFTSKGDLQPTFSSNIVRTPTHYQHPRRSTDELHPTHHSRSPSSVGHSSSSSHAPPVPNLLTRHSTIPDTSSSARDMYATFTEDLTNSLNASSSSRTRSSGTLSRSRTEPIVANLTTIHESSSALSSGEMFLAPLRDPPSSGSPDSSPDPSPRRRDNGRRTSPYTSDPRDPHTPEPSPLYRDRRPSPYAPSRQHGHSYSHSRPNSHSASPTPSPTSPHARARDPYTVAQGSGASNSNATTSTTVPAPGHRRSDNPLPPPPVERVTAEASRPPVQERSPPRYMRKVRAGFWNRRGDHLTSSMYVVYAPHDRAYPEDLRDYPDERDGYRDPYGTFVPWLERPELPTSLPYRGRPPTQPYDSFVMHTYLQ